MPDDTHRVGLTGRGRQRIADAEVLAAVAMAMMTLDRAARTAQQYDGAATGKLVDAVRTETRAARERLADVYYEFGGK